MGTLFVVPDHEDVLERSKSLIVHPRYAHPDDQKRIDKPDTRETMNERAGATERSVCHLGRR
jgi:hypothetical protein